MGIVTALEFLQKTDDYQIPPFCVVFGEESFLRSETLKRLRSLVLSDNDGDFSYTRFDGSSVSYTDVLRATSTLALFGTGRRLVVIEQAETFLSSNKESLEDYISEPSKASVLVLQINSFPSNLRLYKLANSVGLLIDCKQPAKKDVVSWLISRASKECRVSLSHDAAETLVELVGDDLGSLDQETRRLSLLLPTSGRIDINFIRENVGSWRQRKVWDLVDAALEGRTSEALRLFDKLINSGEAPIMVLAQMAASLRKLSAATQLFLDASASGEKLSINIALERVGVRSFFKAKTAEQLKRLGSKRGQKLSQLLVQTDFDLKGGSRSDPRHVLERFIVSISNQEMRTVDFTQ
ncbi:MAG: DNA polymerase III subunit delta [Thermoguttaceae bacterium]|nr:DNA polymerase III subunit delta [Thermoguttaceae bacterium]